MEKGRCVLCAILVTALLAGCITGCGEKNASAGRENASEEDTVRQEAELVSGEPETEPEPSVQEAEPASGNLENVQAPDESGKQESIQERGEESEEQEPVQETENDIPQEDGQYYDFGPVSYDLTNLPPMENEMYAEWEGRIYYRQYSNEDMEDGGLWAYFSPIDDTEKEIMCMEPDGNVTQVGVDYGYDGMYIVEGRIYSQKYTKQGERGCVAYSCALDGSDVREYDSYRVLDVRGDRIICSLEQGGISWIDAKDGQEHVLIPENDWYHGTTYLDATEEEVFYYRLMKNEETEPYDLLLCSVDFQGNMKELMAFTMQEYIDCMPEFVQYIGVSPLFIPFFQILGDDLYFSVGTTNGTANMYSGGLIYGMKKDGSDCQLLATNSYEKYFYLYDDGKNRSLYFKTDEEGDGVAAGGVGMHQIGLYGETQDHIVLWDANIAYNAPQAQAYLLQNPTDSILYYPDHSGICYALLTVQESEELGIAMYKEGKMVQGVRDIEYLDGKLFFTVTDLVYSKEYSIGWRDGYIRGTSTCYCKDLESGEITKLYEY